MHIIVLIESEIRAILGSLADCHIPPSLNVFGPSKTPTQAHPWQASHLSIPGHSTAPNVTGEEKVQRARPGFKLGPPESPVRTAKEETGLVSFGAKDLQAERNVEVSRFNCQWPVGTSMEEHLTGDPGDLEENDIWFDLDVEEELDNKEDLSEDSSDHEETDSDTIGTENAGFGILPYQYEPYATSDEDASDNSEADEEDRTHNTDWCSCQCCTIMASNTENRCCQEIQQVKEEILRTDTSLNCITHHPGFRTVCLDIHVLRTAYYQYRQQYGGNLEESTKRHRYTAYRQFVRWCWGYLGKKVRVVIPSCAVSKIRETFPLQPGETHTGFNFAD
ncbi:uncharacterized protein LOC134253563 [Saccostrea cucullata]|uniref:uncharacterized protein LOC134253563 n=1 Tax=Saccostrea cuccullata TaxID=36930 RepID=UPI002ED29AFE